MHERSRRAAFAEAGGMYPNGQGGIFKFYKSKPLGKAFKTMRQKCFGIPQKNARDDDGRQKANQSIIEEINNALEDGNHSLYSSNL